MASQPQTPDTLSFSLSSPCDKCLERAIEHFAPFMRNLQEHASDIREKRQKSNADMNNFNRSLEETIRRMEELCPSLLAPELSQSEDETRVKIFHEWQIQKFKDAARHNRHDMEEAHRALERWLRVREDGIADIAERNHDDMIKMATEMCLPAHHAATNVGGQIET
jgi:hypothetical protein